MTLHFSIIFNNTNSLSIKIKNDTKYNIYITFDISTKNFLKTFYIPSFKTYRTPFDKWFPKFFNSYQKQFTHINEQKVYNFIKYQIITFLTIELKKLLPISYSFPKINSLQERTTASIKASLHHIYTCTNDEYNILLQNTPHTFHNLTSFYFQNSFKFSPISSNYIYPNLDFSIFKQHQSSAATFTKPFPFKTLKQFAQIAEQQFIQLNSISTNSKHESFFYYTYIKYYLNLAAKNDNINNSNLKNTLQKTFTKTTDPHTFAQIMAYFDIIQFSNTPISELQFKYYQSYLPQAMQYISKKLNIPKISTDLFLPQFKVPEIIPNSLFLLDP